MLLVRIRPVSPALLVEELTDRIASSSARWTRVALDGAPGAGTGDLADALVDPLRVRGREVVRVRTEDYLRPASLRLEHGRDDPDVYYSEWFDFGSLTREVLQPLEDDGSGLVLPALRDADTDRSFRLDRIALQDRGVVVVDGPLLLGAGLAFDLTVHLWLPAASLERRVPEAQRWTVPAFDRYAREVQPERLADHVVRVDRPGRPAVVDSVEG